MINLMAMFIVSALLLGFLGSFHCVAMCGPIALALSGGIQDKWKYLMGRGIYNFGRITTYSILGFFAGLVGHTFLIAGFQKSITIAIGILMVISVLVLHWQPSFVSRASFLTTTNRFIKNIFSRVVHSQSSLGLLIAGIANGILPCGFVYIAMAGAATTQHASDGALYMLFFGLGTVPAMMMVSIFGKIVGLKTRSVISKVTPALMVILGLLLIFRGINMKDHSCCHHVVAIEMNK